MKQSNNIPISGESFFEPMPNKSRALDKKFVPLDQSIIWHMNYLFWKHFTLWEKTYQESYEASLPSGVSESHKDAFVEKSVTKFIHLLLQLEKVNKLPEKIIVLEQGPGTGVYAKKFLDYVKNFSKTHKKNFYKNTLYILQDTSQEILKTSVETLQKHNDHIATYITIPNTLQNKILFARHSNVWDQFPARMLLIEQGIISEIFVQAVTSFHESITKTAIETFILTNPLLWKPLMRSIKFKTKVKKLTKTELFNFPHCKVIKHLANIAVNKQEIIISNAVLDNIQELINLIDWQRNGYCEVVDIIVPDMSGFQKDRRPKKYDGSIATVVNGPLIKAFLRDQNKHARFDKIRGINHTVTMRNNNLQTLLEAKDFITIGEIAVRRDEPIEKLQQNAEALFTLGIDIVGFSDQAFVKPEYLSQKEIIETNIFKQLPGSALMPVLKTRNKTWEEIITLTNKLKEQGITNLFVVTGDPGLEKEMQQDSIETTKKLKDNFFIGGVANADVKNIPKMQEKIQAGTKFFIMQATYDDKKFDAWVKEIKKYKLYEQAPIIAAIVPIVSKRTLSVLQFINDMSVADEVNKKFEHLDNQKLRHEGIKLAKEMVEKYKQTGIFSGIYIYSKSHEVICEIMGFPYRKSESVKDSL